MQKTSCRNIIIGSTFYEKIIISGCTANTFQQTVRHSEALGTSFSRTQARQTRALVLLVPTARISTLILQREKLLILYFPSLSHDNKHSIEKNPTGFII